MAVQIALFPELCITPFEDLPPLAKQIVAFFDSFKSDIYTGELYLSRKFGCCVRTIQRAITFLRDTGWLRWKRRGKKGYRTNLYTVLIQRDVASNVASEPPVSSYTKVIHEKTLTSPTPSFRSWFGIATRSKPPVTPDQAFNEFFALFRAAGAKLNDRDFEKAAIEWRDLSIEDRIGALREACITLPLTVPRFVQLPVNFLRDKPWTRVAMERTLPHPPRRLTAAEEQMERVLKMEIKR